MYRLIIADDEPKIRRGLSRLPWHEIDVEVIGEAVDGEDAFHKAKELQPDLMLVDINMPNLTGLELIRQLKETNPECMIFIVSGYDEFEYAKEAIKLDVYDYILKPVNRKELMSVVKKGIESLDTKIKENNFVKWAKTQMIADHDHMHTQFFKQWIDGGLNDYEIQQNLMALNIDMSTYKTLLIIYILPIKSEQEFILDKELLTFAQLNIINEVLVDLNHKITVKTEKDIILCFVDVEDIGFDKEQQLVANIKQYLDQQIVLMQIKAPTQYRQFTPIYYESTQEIRKKGEILPIVSMARNYIELHFFQPELSLTDVAKHLRVSASYLSKLIKQEIGYSFTELLTQIRIEKAMRLMDDPKLRIYEVSERVGYSTQHYFSAAFKKATGMSPVKYRKERS
ncbi:response regulator [Vallitaleaceae bacterium 9-2]